METAPPTIKSVSASQASAGAQKASEHYNQMIAYRKGTNFGEPAPPPPKPQAAKSLAHGATKLAQDQSEWNEICNMFGWKGTGGKSRTRRGRKGKDKGRKTIRKRRKSIRGVVGGTASQMRGKIGKRAKRQTQGGRGAKHYRGGKKN